MRYVSLHHHSTFSYLDGYALPEAHVRRAGELGMKALALTEHGNVSSHVQLEKAAQKEGVKPIFGIELYTAPPQTQRKNHLTVLARNLEGYRNLLRLTSRGWDNFYYEPTATWTDLEEFNADLVVLSGCTGSLLATSLVGGKNIPEAEASYARARRVAKGFKNLFGNRYFIEVQAFPELASVKKINEGFVRLSQDLKIPLVCTGDVHYTRMTENEMQQILHNVRGGTKQTLEQQAQNWGYDVPLSPPLTDQDILKRLMATGIPRQQAIAAILATEEIAQDCNVVMPKLERVRYPMRGRSGTTMDLWRQWLSEGWKYRDIIHHPTHRLDGKPVTTGDYAKQLKYEMSIIEEKDFVDYFLIVSEIVKYAKDAGIPVGPGRGSAAASLVCYLLRITEVDPLIFPGLLFERFIDISRADLPDIDLDFDSSRRGEVRDKAVEMFGRDAVGDIGTFTKYKAKNSLDDLGRVYRIPKGAVEELKGLMIERSSGDLRASATIEDTVDNFPRAKEIFEEYPDLSKSMMLEGNYKGMGVHAAGLVVASGPLTDVVAVYTRKVKNEVRAVISVDKYDAEWLELLKIDVLGLKTMDMIAEALVMLGKPLEWLYEIPLDDKEVIRGFQENDVVGIFQYDGRAMRSVNAEIRPDNFMEVADVNALARPGPLHNNATAEYVDAKHGRKEARRLHPLLDEICAATHYQIVYQEQILRIVREIGNFDWTHAAYIRKIISRKIGEQEFARQWERFWEGAQANGLDEETAKAIWGQCITAGSYAFNVAHSISYGMLAWWTMYLKRHHPAVFYVAGLRKMDKKKHYELLRDAYRHGLEIFPPDPIRSEALWTTTDKGILAGFGNVPTFGGAKSTAIVKHREAHGLASWDDLISIRGFGKKSVEKYKDFCEREDPFDITKLDRLLDGIRTAIRRGQLGRIPWPTHTSLQVPYQRSTDNVEVIWVGVIRHRNLRELFELNFSRTGVPLDPTTVRDPHLNEWVIMQGVDEEEILTITVDRWKYPKFKEAVWDIRLEHDVVVVKGIKWGRQSRRAISVTQMWTIDPDPEVKDDEEETEDERSA